MTKIEFKIPHYDVPKIKLPDEFKCSICGEPLYIKPYFSKIEEKYFINGHPLIVCENNDCQSPWRNDKVSWHCWIDFRKRYCIDETNNAHNHISEKDRIKWMKKYIPIMRKEYPEYYIKLIELDKIYKNFQMEYDS